MLRRCHVRLRQLRWSVLALSALALSTALAARPQALLPLHGIGQDDLRVAPPLLPPVVVEEAVLVEPGPLGLALRKSASLLDLAARATGGHGCSHPGGATAAMAAAAAGGFLPQPIF